MAEKISTGMANAMLTGDCVKDLFVNFTIGVYGTPQPADADATEGSAPLLGWITVDGGTFTPGSATNGLNFGTAAAGILSKASGETWKMTGLAAAGASPGTQAVWFRAYDNARTTGASTTAVRFDGAIGTSTTFEMQMSNQNIVEGGPSQVNTFTFKIKMS